RSLPLRVRPPFDRARPRARSEAAKGGEMTPRRRRLALLPYADPAVKCLGPRMLPPDRHDGKSRTHSFPKSLDGFEVLERLGRGGAGAVYLARSRGGRMVAIKILNDDMRHDVDVREELAREATLASRLSHDAIVQLRAYVDQPDVAALVFEY